MDFEKKPIIVKWPLRNPEILALNETRRLDRFILELKSMTLVKTRKQEGDLCICSPALDAFRGPNILDFVEEVELQNFDPYSDKTKKPCAVNCVPDEGVRSNSHNVENKMKYRTSFFHLLEVAPICKI